jgi:hypothetical protein
VSNDNARHEDARAIRLGRRLRTLHRCNRMFFAARSEQELLQSICQILVSGDELRLAWVGYGEDDADKTVRAVARAGHGVEFLKQVKISWGGDEPAPAGIAVRTGEACRIDGILADPAAGPWRSAAVAHGFDSCIAVPLVAHSHQAGVIDLRGALTLCTAERGAFDDGAIDFYAELATCLTHAVTVLRGNLAGELTHDVTALRAAEERRRAEDALRKARIDLERVMQMTAMGEMAASIAHEVNQPLGAIVSNGKLTGPQDMNELVREVLRLVRGEVAGQGISVRTELSDELPRIAVNRVQLQQVIANLVMNAVDAMSAVVDRARVLRLKTGVDASGALLIAVEDTGIGIDPGDFDRIFDPFYTTKSHGMGMGLSISRSIVEIHGGRLTVARGEPHGAVFQVALPTGIGTGR